MINFWNNKKVLILGFGKEGLSTYNYIRKYDKDVLLYIMEDRDISLNDNKVIINKVDLNKLNDYDLIIKSPGISLKDIDITNIKDKLTSELNIFMEHKKGHIIGVTGTKGKSTTSSLIYYLLGAAGKEVYLLGNIGYPVLDYIDEINDDSYCVIECSSHQLEFYKGHMDISIILNMFEEHLDHYRSKDDYFKAKMNISDSDILLYTSDNDTLFDYVTKYNKSINKYNISFEYNNSLVYIDNGYITCNNDKVFNENEEFYLKGRHFLKDMMFVLAVSRLLNIDDSIYLKVIKEFKGLEHRMEYVGKYKDIVFYNDSIATIPDAVINACNALKNVDTLIVGGMDRGISYSSLIDYINASDISNILCLPDSGKIIFEGIEGKNAIMVSDVDEAVKIAYDITNKGSICLLSPASPSYGFYKNFEDRGNKYKDAIKKYGE